MGVIEVVCIQCAVLVPVYPRGDKDQRVAVLAYVKLCVFATLAVSLVHGFIAHGDINPGTGLGYIGRMYRQAVLTLAGSGNYTVVSRMPA